MLGVALRHYLSTISMPKIKLSSSDWVDFYRPIVERNRKDVSKLLDFWKSEFGYPVEKGMDFSLYTEECGHFYGCDMEDLLEGNLEELVENGYDRDEVLLCYGVLVYNPEILEEQIAKSTNPDVYISGNIPPQKACQEDGESYNALLSNQTFGYDIVDCYGFGRFWESQGNMLKIEARDIYDLLQGAAYTQLYERLNCIKPKNEIL